jgi:hypothetical protein
MERTDSGLFGCLKCGGKFGTTGALVRHKLTCWVRGLKQPAPPKPLDWQCLECTQLNVAIGQFCIVCGCRRKAEDQLEVAEHRRMYGTGKYVK